MKSNSQLIIIDCMLFQFFRRLCCRGPAPVPPNFTVLCLGLGRSGKSTLLAKLSGEATDKIEPTVGTYWHCRSHKNHHGFDLIALSKRLITYCLKTCWCSHQEGQIINLQNCGGWILSTLNKIMDHSNSVLWTNPNFVFWELLPILIWNYKH